ncbi:hypothetical protein [Maribacter sp. 2210JD10-5]|uniref:hypothetical protein n=1 Tax=Maribacter sp. 2210JD10-5 TaxID=3386272 RepID=UPI0039BC2ECA
MIKYFNVNGIPSEEPKGEFWISQWQNSFSISKEDNTYDIDSKLIQLSDIVIKTIFGGTQNFYSKLPFFSSIYPFGGIDAEIKLSKKDFEKWINQEASKETYQVLYYYDMQNIIGFLQNLVQESKFLFCDFYKTFNENSFLLIEKPIQPNGIFYAAGQHIIEPFSKINHLFINLVSQLDIITKITFEFENMQLDFTGYPKLKSSKVLYGDAKKISSIDFKDTVFEKTKDIQLILNIRNEIVHNASLENIPKVYQVFEKNRMIEKFILIPDTTNGNFDTYKNRKRFFGQDTKLNELLPRLIAEFWKRMEVTIDKLTFSVT